MARFAGARAPPHRASQECVARRSGSQFCDVPPVRDELGPSCLWRVRAPARVASCRDTNSLACSHGRTYRMLAARSMWTCSAKAPRSSILRRTKRRAWAALLFKGRWLLLTASPPRELQWHRAPRARCASDRVMSVDLPDTGQQIRIDGTAVRIGECGSSPSMESASATISATADAAFNPALALLYVGTVVAHRPGHAAPPIRPRRAQEPSQGTTRSGSSETAEFFQLCERVSSVRCPFVAGRIVASRTRFSCHASGILTSRHAHPPGPIGGSGTCRRAGC